MESNNQQLTYTPKNSTALQVVETASTALAAQAQAVIQARYIMAERHPRDLDVVREKLIKECKRPNFCEVAIYNKPIGKGITGLSIRFAEAAIRCMTNIDISTQTIFDDEERRIVRVSVTDLEANVPYSQDVTITKSVERRNLKQGETPIRTRLNSTGQQLYILPGTDDDILNKQGALISKAVRTLGLRIIPGDLADEAERLIRQTLMQKDAQDPDAARKRIFDGFAELGVSADQLKEYLGGSVEGLSPKELSELRGLYTALRDGETSWREIIDAKKPAESAGKQEPATTTKGGASKLKDAVKGTAKPEQTKTETSEQQRPANSERSDSDMFAD
jgi:hypothetical protein